MSSVRTRRAIGFVLSGGSFKPVADYLQGTYVKCESKIDSPEEQKQLSVVYYAHDARSNSVTAFIERAGGIPMMSALQASVGSPGGMKEFIQKMSKKETGGYSMSGGFGWGAVDFDTEYKIYEFGGMHIRVEISAVGGASANIKSDLYCRVIQPSPVRH